MNSGLVKFFSFIIFAVCITTSVSVSANFCPKSRPDQGGRLLYAYCSDLSKNSREEFNEWPDYESNSVVVDAFKADEICACFAYKGSKLNETAVNITTLRYFVVGDGKLLNKTTLYRNSAFFDRKGEKKVEELEDGSFSDKYESIISNEAYDEFHSNYNKNNSKLSNHFHAYILPEKGEHTSEPESRREKFKFLKYKDNEYDVLRRSYLIGITANHQGTWIPFYIGTGANGANGKHLRAIDLKISDLFSKDLNGVYVYKMKRSE